MNSGADALRDSRDEAFIRKALSCDSAKVWFHEEAAQGRARLHVARWVEQAQEESTLGRKAHNGLWAPTGTVLEVKSAFLSDRGEERIHPDKVERVMELHLAGFT